MKKMLKRKNGVFNELASLGIGIATLAIILTVGFLIISQAQTQIATIDSIADVTNESSWSVSYNATAQMANALDDIPGWIPLIVIAAIGGILLSLVAIFRRQG